METYTNYQILMAAMEQSAIDLNCKAGDFIKKENVIVYSEKTDNCRKYLELPFFCNLVSYGGNIVASIDPQIEEQVRYYINKYPVEHCFETPNLHVLNDALKPFSMRLCFMAEYFLPDVEVLRGKGYEELWRRVQGSGLELRILTRDDFAALYTKEWSNALCEKRKELDVLGVGAYKGTKLVGLAGCSADCEGMWQIGVDVLEGYRKQGIAAALTSRLAHEIFQRGKIPFYCAAWSNIGSVRNAIKAGFRPAWTELTAKSEKFVDEMNG